MKNQDCASVRRRFVWMSTDRSVLDGIPSILAISEVMFAVVLWWSIAIFFQTFTHLWISVCVAPFLLLRSENSVKQANVWFTYYLSHLKKHRVRLAQFLFALIAGAT